MTDFYIEIARKFMSENKWRYAETAICKAIGAANREKRPTSSLFRSLNLIRGVRDGYVR